jgi:hypothetical protein
MTPEQITKALDRYIEFLRPQAAPVRFPAEAEKPNLLQQINHIYWMAEEAKKFAESKPDKAMRWLCFIQGVLWREGGFTIAEFKDDNRSEELTCPPSAAV